MRYLFAMICIFSEYRGCYPLNTSSHAHLYNVTRVHECAFICLAHSVLYFGMVSDSQASTHYLGLVVTNPVFGVSEKARLKPVSAATETR